MAPFRDFQHTMHDSVNQAAAPAQQGRASSGSMFGFNNHLITSPDSVQIKTESRDYPHQSAIGLELIHGVGGLPVTQSISAHSWHGQHIPGTTACYNTAVSASEYTSLPYFQPPYTSSPLVDASSITYPTFTSGDQTQPLYYTPEYTTSQNDSPVFGQTSTRRWPMTPQSHISTPERISKQESLQTSPRDNAWPSPIVLEENLQDKKTMTYERTNLSERTRFGTFERSTSPHDTETSLESSDISQSSLDGSKSPGPSATDLRKGNEKKNTISNKEGLVSEEKICCQVCGKKFTRLSNCREHMKQHNPENRKKYPCGSCGRTFGRKTDLRRHYMTRIHDGEKRFSCDLCGRYYSRLDTLHRHKKDGCPERRRREKRLQNTTFTWQYSQYDPLN